MADELGLTLNRTPALTLTLTRCAALCTQLRRGMRGLGFVPLLDAAVQAIVSIAIVRA